MVGPFAAPEEIRQMWYGAGWLAQPKRASPCSLTPQSLNTEGTEDLSDLCVRSFLGATENTEASQAREEIFARREGVTNYCYRGHGEDTQTRDVVEQTGERSKELRVLPTAFCLLPTLH